MLHSLSVVISVNLIIIVLLSVGVIVGLRLYKNIKNEKHQEQGKVIQKIMKTYTIIQCVAWPLIMTCFALLRINKRLIKHCVQLKYQSRVLVLFMKTIARLQMLNDCSKNQTNILLQQILVETLNSPDKNEKEHLC